MKKQITSQVFFLFSLFLIALMALVIFIVPIIPVQAAALCALILLLMHLIKVKNESEISQNRKMVAVLKAGNITMLTLDYKAMMIKQLTPFTYEGEPPESFGGPLDFYDLAGEIIHPQDFHVINDAIHEFRHEGAREKTIDLRIVHRGEWLWFRFYITRDGASELVILGQMIHKEKTWTAELIKRANLDAMTGLANRHYCFSYLEEILQEKRKTDFPVTVAFIDADALKLVNDRLGHNEGDRYLLDIAGILKEEIREEDVLGRIGGDEFLIICPRTSEEDFVGIEKRIREKTEKRNRTSGSPYRLSFSLGAIGMERSSLYTVDRLVDEADKRMYARKREKKNKGLYRSVLKENAPPREAL